MQHVSYSGRLQEALYVSVRQSRLRLDMPSEPILQFERILETWKNGGAATVFKIKRAQRQPQLSKRSVSLLGRPISAHIFSLPYTHTPPRRLLRQQAAVKLFLRSRASMACTCGKTSGTGGMGEMRWESNLSMSRLSRTSRASRATVRGAGGLFQPPVDSFAHPTPSLG